MGNKKVVFNYTIKMYATFKIEENDCSLAGIVSDGKVYKVPCHYNITLDKKGVKCYNPNFTVAHNCHSNSKLLILGVILVEILIWVSNFSSLNLSDNRIQRSNRMNPTTIPHTMIV